MDCGPACVRMLVSFHGKTFPLGFLRTLAALTREGVSVAGIRRALASVKMESAAFRMTLDELSRKCPTPAILHWNQNHFVVLERVVWRNGRRRWKIADPAFGRHVVDDDTMGGSWLSGGKGVVVAAHPAPGFEAQNPVSERHSFIRFARLHVWPFRSTILRSAAVMLVGTLLSLILPFLTQIMVDSGINARDTNLIFTILGAQLAVIAGSYLMQFLGSRIALYMSTHISVSIISGYLEKLMKMPMNFFDTKSPGDHQQRISDHNRLQSFMTVESLQTLFSLFSIPFYLVIIGSYSLQVVGAYILFTALAILWSVRFFHLRRAVDYEQFQLNSRLQNRIFEITNGITDIKVNGYESFKINQWKDLQRQQYDLGRKALGISQKQDIGFSALSQTRNLLILCWIALEVVDGSMTLGMMMSVSVIIGMVSGPLGQLVSYLQRIQDARISLERSDEVSNAPDEDLPGMLEVPADHPLDIRLDRVSFTYGSIGAPAVENVSFSIPGGSFIAIVGESGSGKTTLLKLLLKFYNPDSGEIWLGHNKLAQYSARSLRAASGVVMQDNFLFSDTLECNISLCGKSDHDRMEKALECACLKQFVVSRPLGTNTLVGAEGNGLSGGERQRIMMARVAYRRPPYILLDEATSNLDAETEHRIAENVATDFKESTRIVIAHRLSTVRDADMIVVMRHGRIVEMGTHIQLVEKGGYYLSLIRNQLELPQ